MEQPLSKRPNVGTFNVSEQNVLPLVEQLCRDSEENVNAWNRLLEIANYLRIDSSGFRNKAHLCRAILDRLGIKDLSSEVLLEITGRLTLGDILKLIYTNRVYLRFFGPIVSKYPNPISEEWIRFFATRLEEAYGPNQALALSMLKDLFKYGYPCYVKIDIDYLVHVVSRSDQLTGLELTAFQLALWTKNVPLFDLCVSSPMFSVNEKISLPGKLFVYSPFCFFNFLNH